MRTSHRSKIMQFRLSQHEKTERAACKLLAIKSTPDPHHFMKKFYGVASLNMEKVMSCTRCTCPVAIEGDANYSPLRGLKFPSVYINSTGVPQQNIVTGLVDLRGIGRSFTRSMLPIPVSEDRGAPWLVEGQPAHNQARIKMDTFRCNMCVHA